MRTPERSPVWGVAVILAVISAGAALGDETAQYFWDLSSYVISLDQNLPYQSTASYPFLYPPSAGSLFTLARSHLFELLSISYVAAMTLFILAYSRVNMPRRFEWLLAITGMGGLGMVSLKTGNVAILMNFGLLGLAIRAASGRAADVNLLALAIFGGALIKPQFLLYIGLIPCVDRSFRAAAIKVIAVGAATVAVHAGYMVLRPVIWNEYVQAVTKRALVQKDFGWGPAALMTRFTDSNNAALSAFAAGFLLIAIMAYIAWRRTDRTAQQRPDLSLVMLAFVVLTFANPRLPLYDVYAAGIALVICCGLVDRPIMVRTLVIVLAINLIPWVIDEFTRTPTAWAWWTKDLLLTHMLGLIALLGALCRTGLHAGPKPALIESRYS